MAITIQDPIAELADVVQSIYPDLDCDVSFASFPDEGPFGQTIFPDNGGRAIVQVAVGLPMEAALEIMSHELAHVAVGIKADHGPEWEAAFDSIHRAYAGRMNGDHGPRHADVCPAWVVNERDSA